MEPSQPAAEATESSAETIAALRHKIGEYERWFRFLDLQNRILERERQKLSAVLNHADAGFLVFDPSLNVVWANKVFTERFFQGTGPAAVIGAKCCRILCGQLTVCSTCPAAQTFRTSSVAHHEIGLEIDREPRCVYATAMPIKSPFGDTEEAILMLQDVSGLQVLRRSQEALKATEARLELLVEQMPAILWSTDGELRLTSSVGAGLAALGRSANQSVGLTLYEYFKTDDPGYVPIACHLRAIAGESVSYETEWMGRAFQAHVEPFFAADGSILGSIGVALDITDREHAQRALRQSEARKGAILETAVDAILSMDHQGRITEFNSAAEAMFGYGRRQALGTPMADLIIPPSLRERHRAALARHLTTGEGRILGRRVEMTGLRADGSEFPIELVVARIPLEGPPSFTAYVRDLTERKQAERVLHEREEQLLQSQKMEAIGNLAGGVAHDFNNLLTGILGQAELLKLGCQPGEAPYQAADVIERTARRAAELTHQLLGFARRGKNQNVPIDVHATIAEVLALLGRTLEKNIRIVKDFRATRACVTGDPAQLQQVILSLAVNARDAMPQGGTLSFRTAEVSVPPEDPERDPPASGGKAHLEVTVADTGRGIPAEILDKVFEPFVTTKEPGRGSGMGLAMVYGIVQNHGGSVAVESAPGQGTTFRIRLPLSEEPAPAGRPAPTRGMEPATGRILVVDDEAVVRDVAADYLRRLGYEVLTAPDGEEAVARFQQESRIDLVLVDLMMPAMGGRDCFRALKRIDPAVRVVLTTGFGIDVAAQEILDEGVMGFLRKPYELRRLSELIASLLRSGSPSLR